MQTCIIPNNKVWLDRRCGDAGRYFTERSNHLSLNRPRVYIRGIPGLVGLRGGQRHKPPDLDDTSVSKLGMFADDSTW